MDWEKIIVALLLKNYFYDEQLHLQLQRILIKVADMKKIKRIVECFIKDS